jgi:hypothetical protein
VQLAQQIYDYVDDRIRQLDKDLELFDSEVEKERLRLGILDEDPNNAAITALEEAGAVKDKDRKKGGSGQQKAWRKKGNIDSLLLPVPALGKCAHRSSLVVRREHVVSRHLRVLSAFYRSAFSMRCAAIFSCRFWPRMCSTCFSACSHQYKKCWEWFRISESAVALLHVQVLRSRRSRQGRGAKSKWTRRSRCIATVTRYRSGR